MKRTKKELSEFNELEDKTFMEFITFVNDKYLIDVLFGRISVNDLFYECGICVSPFGWKKEKFHTINGYKKFGEIDHIHLIQDELKERKVK